MGFSGRPKLATPESGRVLLKLRTEAASLLIQGFKALHETLNARFAT